MSTYSSIPLVNAIARPKVFSHHTIAINTRHHLSRQPKLVRFNSSHAAYRAALQQRNYTMLNYSLSVLIGTLALAYGSVPLYKTVCQTMGWGGQPVKAPNHTSGAPRLTSLRPPPDAPRIRITFSSSTAATLPWTFTPTQRSVYVRPGETALAFYTARNTHPTDDIIGVATYSVTPAQLAPYFSKIQCFCFEEQRLAAGETVDMPVFFYLDPAMLDDVNTRRIETVTLHYTFFKAKYAREEHMNPTSKK